MQSVLTVSSKQLGFQSFPRLQRVAIWVVLPRWKSPPTSHPELSKPTVTWLSLFRSALITSPFFYLPCQLFFLNRLYLFLSSSLSLSLFLPSVSARVEVALLSIVLFSVTSFPLEFCLYAACVCVCYLCVTFFCFVFKVCRIAADRVNSVWRKAWTGLMCKLLAVGIVPACHKPCMSWQRRVLPWMWRRGSVWTRERSLCSLKGGVKAGRREEWLSSCSARLDDVIQTSQHIIRYNWEFSVDTRVTRITMFLCADEYFQIKADMYLLDQLMRREFLCL